MSNASSKDYLQPVDVKERRENNRVRATWIGKDDLVLPQLLPVPTTCLCISSAFGNHSHAPNNIKGSLSIEAVTRALTHESWQED